jgi:hypothetical protein
MNEYGQQAVEIRFRQPGIPSHEWPGEHHRPSQSLNSGASEHHAFRATPLEKAMDGLFQQPVGRVERVDQAPLRNDWTMDLFAPRSERVM